MNQDELNKIFNTELSYILIKYIKDPSRKFEYNIFSNEKYYKIITSLVIDEDAIIELVKEIIYNLNIHNVAMINTRDLMHDISVLFKRLWKQTNYADYKFEFSSHSNNSIILTVFPKDPNPRKSSAKALFQIEDQQLIRKFIMDIVDCITDKYEEYSIFTIKEGGINFTKEYSVCINSRKMKQILKDYTTVMYNLGYKE